MKSEETFPQRPPPVRITAGMRFRGWLQLFRIPNLFTVPAEPFAGFLLASSGVIHEWQGIGLMIAALLCFYSAGLIWNDVQDQHRDARKHLRRPIPMRLVSPSFASWLAWALALGGLILCWRVSMVSLAYGACLLCCVIAYDFYLKRVPVLGVISMGLCRGISLLLGATIIPPHQSFPVSVWIGAFMVTAYVATVTQLAKRERYPHNPSLEVWGPCSVILLGSLLFIQTIEEWSWELTLILLIVLALPFAAALHLHSFRSTRNLPRTLDSKARIPNVLPPWIGYLIAHLLWINMFFVLSNGVTVDTLTVCAILLGCWLLNRLLARFFYAS